MMRNERGETIVEVLIVVAILGAVLVGTFSIANRTLLNARQSQERSEAVGIGQDQLERLKRASDNILLPTGKFCLYGTGTTMSRDVPNSIGNPTAASVLLADYPPECRIKNRYHMFIEYSATARAYTVYVHWENATGSGQDRLSMLYRVHSGESAFDTINQYITTVARLGRL